MFGRKVEVINGLGCDGALVVSSDRNGPSLILAISLVPSANKCVMGTMSYCFLFDNTGALSYELKIISSNFCNGNFINKCAVSESN